MCSFRFVWLLCVWFFVIVVVVVVFVLFSLARFATSEMFQYSKLILFCICFCLPIRTEDAILSFFRSSRCLLTCPYHLTKYHYLLRIKFSFPFNALLCSFYSIQCFCFDFFSSSSDSFCFLAGYALRGGGFLSLIPEQILAHLTMPESISTFIGSVMCKYLRMLRMFQFRARSHQF